ncbi:hypothetical protein PPACK8108_LOCUS23260 [Phakopsora pachyrhizi]|uniref:Uncharacterized protein n=1 Tax=Phakopsora pachyrhizi TaxID=170000 RepID=A0AAV0BQ22_PHAPC|nr:hypothetical protein PPACK8108_LOCUS23260 [Phakopsora pachyrhizi]
MHRAKSGTQPSPWRIAHPKVPTHDQFGILKPGGVYLEDLSRFDNCGNAIVASPSHYSASSPVCLKTCEILLDRRSNCSDLHRSIVYRTHGSNISVIETMEESSLIPTDRRLIPQPTHHIALSKMRSLTRAFHRPKLSRSMRSEQIRPIRSQGAQSSSSANSSLAGSEEIDHCPTLLSTSSNDGSQKGYSSSNPDLSPRFQSFYQPSAFQSHWKTQSNGDDEENRFDPKIRPVRDSFELDRLNRVNGSRDRAGSGAEEDEDEKFLSVSIRSLRRTAVEIGKDRERRRVESRTSGNLMPMTISYEPVDRFRLIDGRFTPETSKVGNCLISKSTILPESQSCRSTGKSSPGSLLRSRTKSWDRIPFNRSHSHYQISLAENSHFRTQESLRSNDATPSPRRPALQVQPKIKQMRSAKEE